jgi:hypothetical protein
VSADDDAGTVTLHLRRPEPDLLWGMALSFFAPAPVDHGPIPGTGPYRIARLVRNRLIDLRATRTSVSARPPRHRTATPTASSGGSGTSPSGPWRT